MYQIKADGGWEIQVIGSGEKGLCRVIHHIDGVQFTGTYAECVRWLESRAVRIHKG